MTCWSEFGFNGSRNGWPQPEAALPVPLHPASVVAPRTNPTDATVFSWIGVTMYLTTEAIRATLATIATCAPGTRIVLTYNQPHSTLNDLAREVETTIRRFANESGEPFVSLFSPAEIEELLKETGFTEIAHSGPEEAIRAYFPGRSDVHFRGAQRLITATVAGKRI